MSMMMMMMTMQIVVEVAGTVYDVYCSIFTRTVDRQRPPAVWHVMWAEAASLAAAEKCVYALAVRRRDKPRVTHTSAATRRPLGRRCVECRLILVIPWCCVDRL